MFSRKEFNYLSQSREGTQSLNTLFKHLSNSASQKNASGATSHLVTRCLRVLVTFLLGVPAIAVGLSALSLLAFVFSSLPKILLNPIPTSPNPNSHYLAKDAAPIPNALAMNIKSQLSTIYINLKNVDVSFDFIKFISTFAVSLKSNCHEKTTSIYRIICCHGS